MIKTVIAAPPRAEQISWRDRFLADALEGLRQPQKTLPCKYFYDEHGSMLFDRICELDEYYLTRTELSILRTHARAMAAAIGEDCDLIELGSGSSLKTRLLLERLRKARAYLPVDISREHLERSAQAVADRFPGLSVVPVHADFTAPFALPETGEPRARRVVYFPGSTIGNFSPDAARALLVEVAELVGDGGGLLIGFDLEKDATVLLPAYNDRKGVTAAFNLNILRRINRELAADFDLDAFAHRAVYVRERERVEMHLISLRAQVVRISGQSIAFEEGETIHTESSHKYPLDHIRRMTADAGFTLEEQWMDKLGYFSVQYLTIP
jgi:dimethylhistidine N-methyltransferase